MTEAHTANGSNQLMTMQKEAEAYANGAWDCEVAYVNEGNGEDSEPFFDLVVPGQTVPSGLLGNLNNRGFRVAGIVGNGDEVQITVTPDK